MRTFGEPVAAAPARVAAACVLAALCAGYARAQDPAGPPSDEQVATGAPGDAAEVVATEEALSDDPALALPVRYTGRIVALRTLVAPEGGLPAESLEPLLRIQQDSVYDPQAVRQDIAMLHRVLDFAKVEVDVEDWVAFDADGEAIPAVRVEYRVYPPPRLVSVDVRGARALSRREIQAAIGREVGDPFYAEDADRARASIVAAYAAVGYPAAKARVARTVDAERRVALEVTVDEGAPDRVGAVRVRGAGALSGLRVRYILSRHGIVPGRPWTESALQSARDDLTDVLRKKGWYEGRVAVQLDAAEDGRRAVVVLVDPRRKWEIVRDGKGLPTKGQIVDRLGLTAGVRPSRRFGEEAARTLTESLRAESRLEAKVDVRLDEGDDAVTLTVTGDAGPRHRLGQAKWEGDTVYDARYLTGALKEASPDLLARGRVVPEGVDAALEVLQEFYRSQGYLSARLTRVGFTERAAPEARAANVVPVDVRIHVEAGPRAVLRQVAIDGAVGDVDAEGLFADLEGKPLNPAEVDARSRRLVDMLAEAGFLAADARVSTIVDPDGKAADVRIEVTTGPPVYLRSVILRGYRRTRRSVIEREIDLHPGDPLAPSRLAAIRRRLYELDLFSRVSVELVGDEDRVKDLIVEVEERPNLHAETGGGVATDQGFKVFVRGGHRNLFGLGHRLTLIGQAGIGWVGDGWSLDWAAPEWKAAARYEAPNIPARGERVAIDAVFNEQDQEPSYRLERSGGGLGVLLRLGQKGTAELAYRVQFRRLLDVDPGAVVEGDPWLDELVLSDLDNPTPTLPSAVRPQSGLDLSFVVDLRDDAFNPTKGSVGSVLVNLTDEIFSDLTFLRAEGSWTWWLPVGGFGLQGRLRAGAGWVPGGEQTLPLEDRFRLGGGASLRGFVLDSVGPANEVSREDIPYNDGLQPILDYAGRDEPSRWVSTGGDAMALGSIELRIPFERLGLKRWAGTQLALFADTGNVWFLEPDVTDSMREGLDPALRWSVGVGLRRATVIGPIQVDVGFNPVPLTEREEGLVKLHVSLGAL